MVKFIINIKAHNQNNHHHDLKGLMTTKELKTNASFVFGIYVKIEKLTISEQ